MLIGIISPLIYSHSSLYSFRSLELPVNPCRKCIMSSFGYSTSLCGFCCYGSWSTILLYVHWSCTNNFKESWREACVDSRCFILHVSFAAFNWFLFSYFFNYLHIFKYLPNEILCHKFALIFFFVFRLAVIPVILCPGLGSIFACGLVFGCGVIYGMMGLGKK